MAVVEKQFRNYAAALAWRARLRPCVQLAQRAARAVLRLRASAADVLSILVFAVRICVVLCDRRNRKIIAALATRFHFNLFDHFE